MDSVEGTDKERGFVDRLYNKLLGGRSSPAGQSPTQQTAHLTVPANGGSPNILAATAQAAAEADGGEVDEGGAVVRGTRFTAERTGTGEYEVFFATPFLAPPVVIAVAQSCAC